MSKLRRFLSPGPDGDESGEIHRLERLQEMSKAINSELNLSRLLERIMDIAVELTGAERGFMILQAGEKLRVAVARNIDREKVLRPEFKISRSIAERVVESRQALLSANALDDADLSVFSSVMTLKLKSVLCVPLVRKEVTVGAVYLDHRYLEGKFSPRDLESMEAVADQAAVALENARLYEENVRANQELEIVNQRLQEELKHRRQELSEVKARLDSAVEKNPALRSDFRSIIGSSDAIKRVFALLDRIVDADLAVLIQGESGTGKELVARFLHFHGRRKEKEFVTLNCGAIPGDLLESELFGAKKGAFTGAHRDRPGLLSQADGGTLFLDEISELPMPLQAKLLRALQGGEIRPVGSIETTRVDVRIISATNRDLESMVECDGFRSDLYFRLKGVVVWVPPLRERPEDIPQLVEHFLGKLAATRPENPTRMSPIVLRHLMEADWPGNVRELENEVSRLSALTEGPVIDDPNLLDGFESPSLRLRRRGARGLDRSRPLSLDEIERMAIIEALERCQGNKAKAAKELEIPRRTFYDKLRRHRIDPSEGKS